MLNGCLKRYVFVLKKRIVNDQIALYITSFTEYDKNVHNYFMNMIRINYKSTNIEKCNKKNTSHVKNHNACHLTCINSVGLYLHSKKKKKKPIDADIRPSMRGLNSPKVN